MYTIEQLSTMTGLTTRTLRNYIRLDVLSGQKDAGSWRFSEEEVSDFFKNPSVRKSIQAKHHGIVYDFLAGYEHNKNDMCVMLDLDLEEEEAGAVSDFFCGEACRVKPIRFAFSYEKHTAHVVLKGPQETLLPILAAYEARFSK